MLLTQNQKLKLKDKSSFDLIICTGVLQTLDDPESLIRELTRTIHPEGSIIVVTHNSHSFIRKIAPRRGFKHLHGKELVEQTFAREQFYPTVLRGIHYPRLKSVEITRFTFIHKYFCTTLIWKFMKDVNLYSNRTY